MKFGRFLHWMGLLAGGLIQFLSSTALAESGPTFNYRLEKNFEALTPSEHTAAKKTALTTQFPLLRVCADPGNMPLSNIRREGLQNRIAQVLAKKMGAKVSYFWRLYLERGLTRETFANNECDLLMGMPEGHGDVLTTVSIYRSTYVLAYRSDRGLNIESLDDPILKKLRVGVFQHSGLREAFSRHGLNSQLQLHVISHDADLVPENQPWRQVQKVVDGELDVAGVWGPFAGFLKAMKGAPLTLQPVNLMDDVTPLEFSVAIGLRKSDVVLKYALDNALEASKDKIRKILTDFGVPLVQCSPCVVSGDLPSHGSYYERFLEASQKRFLEPLDSSFVRLDESTASADQLVTRARLKQWLADGADLQDELENAVLASDHDRVKFLIEKGAGVDESDKLGFAPLHTAARYRDSDMISLLLALDADPNLPDADGWMPLIHTAYRNHVPSVRALAAAGADLEARTPKGLTALLLAIGERKFYAVKALLEAGAAVDVRLNAGNLTPLMLMATQTKAFDRTARVAEGPDPIETAKTLIEHGADVNTVSADGVTPLMIAAGHDNAAMIGLLVQSGANLDANSKAGKTALDIAREGMHDAAVRTLQLFSNPGQSAPIRAQ